MTWTKIHSCFYIQVWTKVYSSKNLQRQKDMPVIKTLTNIKYSLQGCLWYRE